MKFMQPLVSVSLLVFSLAVCGEASPVLPSSAAVDKSDIAHSAHHAQSLARLTRRSEPGKVKEQTDSAKPAVPIEQPKQYWWQRVTLPLPPGSDPSAHQQNTYQRNRMMEKMQQQYRPQWK